MSHPEPDTDSDGKNDASRFRRSGREVEPIQVGPDAGQIPAEIRRHLDPIAGRRGSRSGKEVPGSGFGTLRRMTFGRKYI